MFATHMDLVVSGNYGRLNWVTIVVMTAALADPVLQTVVPGLATKPRFRTWPKRREIGACWPPR